MNAESTGTNYLLPLIDILGHERTWCSVPEGLHAKRQQWAEEPFLKVVEKLKDDHKKKLVFVDMLFSRVSDNTFFGGVVTAGQQIEHYEGILDSLFRDYITVGTHPVFQRGLTKTDDRVEQWLFSEVTKANAGSAVSDGGEGGTANGDSFSALWINAEEKIPTLLPHETPASWLAKASRKNVTDVSWKALITKLSIDGGGLHAQDNTFPLKFVAGIPITVPPCDHETAPFHVASLFVGVSDTERSEAIGTIGAIAHHLIPFALRTYALQKAQQAGLLKVAEAKANIYSDVEKNLKELIGQVRELGQTALRVEAAITISNEDFLGHSDLVRLFIGKDISIHYRFLKNDGECQKIKGPVYDQAELVDTDGWEPGTLDVVHNACDAEKWKKIATFLELYGQAQHVALFKDFGSVRLEDGNGNNDNIAMKTHGLLKSLVQRPTGSPDRLFEVQIAIAIATAWREKLADDREVKVKFDGDDAVSIVYDINKKHIKLFEFVKSLGTEHFACDNDRAARIDGTVRTADVLGALMRLVAKELVAGKRAGANENVEASSVLVHGIDQYIDVFIECSGRFGDLNESCQLSETSEQHGFQSCLKELCGAVGQRQPALAYSNRKGELEKLAVASQTAQFVIGQSPEDTGSDGCVSIFLRFRKTASLSAEMVV